MRLEDYLEENKKRGDDLNQRDHRLSAIEGDWDWRD
jgi:hypothetical protein